MIHSLELENFKGFSSRQRIEFAPLTLLFGANSAGKSTVLQALLYVHEVLSTGLADIDRTELGGQAVDLGGFGRLVHRHDARQAMRIRIGFGNAGGLNPFHHILEHDYLSDLDDALTDAWVEIAVATQGAVPKVTELIVGSVGETQPLLRLTPAGSAAAAIATIEVSHPLLAPGKIVEGFGARASHVEKDHVGILISTPRGSLIPALDESVIIEDEFDPEETLEARHLIEMLTVGVLRQLVRVLGRTLYLGPLRMVPPRSFLSERSRRQSGWADGMAAWDALLSDSSGALVASTNKWLARLGARCEVRIQDLFDPESDAVKATDLGPATVRRLVLKVDGADVLPAEVGTGISQLVPVVVAALVGERKPVALIEQPELHVHPALQVALGDLFIENCGPRHKFIVETHSEHLILRILRRIRDTTDREVADGAPLFSRESLGVWYAESSAEGARIVPLRVDERGEFIDRWPKGFFEERAEELF
jgi:hypothetical protein